MLLKQSIPGLTCPRTVPLKLDYLFSCMFTKIVFKEPLDRAKQVSLSWAFQI